MQKRKIGLDERKLKTIQKNYSTFAEALTALHHEVHAAIPDITMPEFVHITRLPEGADYEVQRLIYERHPEKYGAFPLKALIENKMFDINNLQQIIAQHSFVRSSRPGSSQYFYGFYFPIPMLWDAENHCFTLTDAFNAELLEFCAEYLETPEQHQIFTALERMVEGLNLLCEFGLAERSQNLFPQLSRLFNLDDSDVWSIRSTAFQICRLRHFASEKTNLSPSRVYQIKSD
jgi:hypothetical protein